MIVAAKPLVPKPSDLNCRVAEPARRPAAEVSSPTRRVFPLLAPDDNLLTAPAIVAAPVKPEKLASSVSENPSLAAVLAIDSACDRVAPTWALAKLTAAGAAPF